MTANDQRANVYSDRFYDTYVDTSASSSARAVVPVILDLLAPRSVVDVGCGRGVWLSVFAERGIDDYLGIDGPWVNPQRLAIPPERFRVHDLAASEPLDRRFDLAVSLEVAEHLPEGSAASFIDLLTTASDAILFSAAVPGQGGADHVNEQWPGYWVQRFTARGYQVLDCVRWRVWDDEKVASFYAQNTFVAVRPEVIDRVPELAAWVAAHPDLVGEVRPLVHPSLFADKRDLFPEQRYSAADLAGALLRRLGNSIEVRTRRLRRRG